MKTPFDPTDPILQSFANEATDLPLKAAAEARRTRARRMRQRRHVALAITVLLCGVCAWRLLPQRDAGRELIAVQEPLVAPMNVASQTATPSHQPGRLVIVRTEEQAMKEPLPLPDGLTEQQANVVKAARGLPLLLVRDRSGKVARIQVIER